MPALILIVVAAALLLQQRPSAPAAPPPPVAQPVAPREPTPGEVIDQVLEAEAKIEGAIISAVERYRQLTGGK